MKDKIKVMIYGDGVVPTGFSNVLKGIFGHFDKSKYEISWLAINYFGDACVEQSSYKLYPASTKGNLYGLNRIVEVITKESPDVLFMLNDPWVLSAMLREIKQANLETLPKIISILEEPEPRIPD